MRWGVRERGRPSIGCAFKQPETVSDATSCASEGEAWLHQLSDKRASSIAFVETVFHSAVRNRLPRQNPRLRGQRAKSITIIR